MEEEGRSPAPLNTRILSALKSHTLRSSDSSSISTRGDHHHLLHYLLLPGAFSETPPTNPLPKNQTMIKKMSPSESDFSIPAKNCYRMVILGSTKVGKTAIVSRFLSGRFEEQYTPTIEDFHRKLYSIKGDVYQLDILDTSGNHPFPAMRRLSILTGTWTRDAELSENNTYIYFFLKKFPKSAEN